MCIRDRYDGCADNKRQHLGQDQERVQADLAGKGDFRQLVAKIAPQRGQEGQPHGQPEQPAACGEEVGKGTANRMRQIRSFDD